MSLFKNMLAYTYGPCKLVSLISGSMKYVKMMHREVNYHVEAATTRRFAERLKDDERLYRPYNCR